MAEKSEHEASKSGQDVETPETDAHKSKDAERGADLVSAEHDGVKRDRQGEPYGDSGVRSLELRESDIAEQRAQEPVDGAGQTYPTNPEQPKPYSESDDHVPDPTAMSGTMETSGTGGGVHESLKGTTEVFADLPANVELDGLPLFRSDVVSGDGTGQPEPHRGEDARIATTEDRATEEQAEEAERNRPAADAGDVSAGTTSVAQPESTSYSENVIAGAADPQARRGESRSEGAFTTATTRQTEDKAEEDNEGETPESEAKDGESKSTPAKKTTARKTTAAKKTT